MNGSPELSEIRLLDLESQSLHRHSLSDAWGSVGGREDFAGLVNSIRRNGFDSSHAIVLYDGDVLDGWNRYEAAREVELSSIPCRDYIGDSPEIFVVRENSNRRHLTKTERAIAALRCLPMAGVGGPKDGEFTMEQVAEMVGVSRPTVAKAKEKVAGKTPAKRPASTSVPLAVVESAVVSLCDWGGIPRPEVSSSSKKIQFEWASQSLSLEVEVGPDGPIHWSASAPGEPDIEETPYESDESDFHSWFRRIVLL